MKKKNMIRAGIAAIAGTVIIGAGIFFSGHVYIDNAFFPKDAGVIDLTDHDLSEAEYLQIQQQFPDKQILWAVPFQGTRYSPDTESITIASLTEEEAKTLGYLVNLKQVDATQCTDYSALSLLQEHLPNCTVLYQISNAGSVRSDARELTVTDADAAELNRLLPLLPNLHTLTLEGTLPVPEDLLELKNANPAVTLDFALTVGGQEFPTDTKTIDLANAQVTLQEIQQALPLFSNAEELILTGSSLTDAELKGLIGQFPELFVLCDLDFAGKTFSTDSTEIDISNTPVSVEEVEALLPCFPRLTWLNMSYCGIDDESMDALNRRWPDISIVWTMKIGLATVRTDDTIFFPAKIKEYDLPSNDELQKLRYCTEMIAIDIGHSKASDCNWAAYMPHLKFLIMADTKLTDLTPLSNAKELLYLEVFTTYITDYTPLLGCTSLQDLNIGSTYGDPEPLTQMTWLHNLFWHGILEDPEISERAQLLPEQLPDTNVVLKTPYKNSSGMWRYLPNYYVFRELLDARFFNQEYIARYQEPQDAKRLLACDRDKNTFAGDVLGEIVRYRIDNQLPIPGIKNIGSEKAEIMYQTLVDSRNWYAQ